MGKIDRAINSCGIRNYEGMYLKTPSEVMEDVANIMLKDNPQDGAYVTFSNPVHRKNIKQLKKYIEKEGLGKTVYLDERINPNSSNKIGFLIWYYDHDVFYKWAGSKGYVDFIEPGMKVKLRDDYRGWSGTAGKTYTIKRNVTHYYVEFKEEPGCDFKRSDIVVIV